MDFLINYWFFVQCIYLQTHGELPWRWHIIDGGSGRLGIHSHTHRAQTERLEEVIVSAVFGVRKLDEEGSSEGRTEEAGKEGGR